MAEKYREFDSDTVALSDVVIRGWRFSRREIGLGVAVIVLLLIVVVLAACLGAANNNNNNNKGDSSSSSPSASGQTGSGKNSSSSSSSSSSSGGSGSSGSGSSCPSADDTCYTPACFRSYSHVLDLVDPKAADPCQDFHSYACGNFRRLHPLMPDEGEITTLQLVYYKNMERLRRLVEAVPSTDDPNHYEVKMKNFYRSCVDTMGRMGTRAKSFLEKVVKPSGGWWVLVGDSGWPPSASSSSSSSSSSYSFQSQLEKVHVDFWTDAFFTFSLAPDWVDWNKATLEIFLGGLQFQMGTYLNDTTMALYRDYIHTVGNLLMGDAEELKTLPKQEWDLRLNTFVNDVLFVESELAKLMRGARGENDPHSLDKRPTLRKLNQMSGNAVDWVSLFRYMMRTSSGSLVTEDTTVVVYEQEYVLNFTAWINNLDAGNKSRILNNYMVWRMAAFKSEYLSVDYSYAGHKLLEAINGKAEALPPWYFCLLHVDYALEDALSALFVKDHFSQKNKDTVHNITDHVKTMLLDSLTSNQHWMSATTRNTARQKIKDSLIKLGYPNFMTNETAMNNKYASVTLKEDDLTGNLLSIHELHRQQWVEYYRNQGDRSVWVYPAYSVTYEYYSPWKELIVPAGVLQFPIFDHSSPWVMNFGSLGSLVARELVHAVDEIGNQFHLNGSHFGEWWSANTTAQYRTVRQCMVDAYSNYKMGSGPYKDKLSVSYHYTPYALSESSGVKLAFKAYKDWLRATGGEKSMPGGMYSNDKLFFLAYAQSFCANRNLYQEYENVMYYGYGATEKVRVNGALAQLPEFQKAFQCSSSNKMVAKKRCSLY